MDGFDEELGLFDRMMSRFGRKRLAGVLVGGEQIMREFAPGVGIEEHLGVVIAFAEFIDDLIR